MTTLTVHDPAMCCAAGLCGTVIDQRLVDLTTDLDWLRTQGVSVQRFGLSREPSEFAANVTVRQIFQKSEGNDLPVSMADGALKATPSPVRDMAFYGVTPGSAPAKETGNC